MVLRFWLCHSAWPVTQGAWLRTCLSCEALGRSRKSVAGEGAEDPRSYERSHSRLRRAPCVMPYVTRHVQVDHEMRLSYCMH
jgi:hypothetical protein